MDALEIENGAVISKEEYEQYKKLKYFRRRAFDNFATINTLVFRLNVFVDLLLDDNGTNSEEICFNLESAAEELAAYCKKYEQQLNTYFENESA